MVLSKRDAWCAARVMAGRHVNGELDATSDRVRNLLKNLNVLPLDQRQGKLEGVLFGWEPAEAAAFNLAVLDQDPDGPEPPPDAPPAPDPWPPLRAWTPKPAPPFPLAVFPPMIRGYCLEVSESTRAPVDFAGVSVLGVASAAIGQSVNVRVKRGWDEPAILNLAIVADPGKAKTPPIRAAQRALAIIDAEMRERSKAEREAWEERKKAHAKDPNAQPPGPEPPQLRAIVKDITRETVSIILQDNPRGVLCAPDELTAWTQSFNQYKSKGGTDKQFWLSLYTAEAVSVDRKGGRENIFVPHPFVSVLGGIQPDVLKTLRDDRGCDDGFLDRINFSFPDVFPSQVWVDQEITAEAERDWEQVVRRLHEVDMRWNGGTPHPWTVVLTDDARRTFVAWYNDRGRELDDPDASDGRGGAISKSRALLLRLALVLSRLRLACDPTQALVGPNGPPPVELVDIEGAAELAAYFEAHRAHAADRITAGQGDVGAAKLLAWIKRNKLAAFREADASAGLRALREPEALRDAVDGLVRSGVIRRKQEPPAPGKRGPKPSPAYEAHPDLF